LEDSLINYKRRIDLGEEYLIDTYNIKVCEYNSLLNQYNSQLSKYTESTNFYNLKVDEANKLIKRSSTRWYIVPIPISSSGNLRGKP